MEPNVSLRSTAQRNSDGSSVQAGTQANTMAAGDNARYSKPSLSAGEYMAELNERLQRHSMYLTGMHFPDPQPGSTPMLAAALAWEGPWDCMGVFASVIEDVAHDYDLAT